MAGGWPIPRSLCNSSSYLQSLTDSIMTVIPSNVSANTVGSWIEVTSSSATDVAAVLIEATGNSASGNFQAVDIGVGAAGSEIVIAANMILHDYSNGACCYCLPVAISAGSRIAVRTQGDGASDSAQVGVITLDSGWTDTVTEGAVDTIGFTGSGTYGTSVDPGASANTAGAWTQLTASTATGYTGFMLAITRSASSGTAATYMVDIGIGAGGSEVVILSRYPTWSNNSPGVMTPSVTGYFGVNIPAGSRIAARAYSNNSTTGVRQVWVTMYAFRN